MTYSRLANPRETRAVLEDFGLATKHRLGQNFLVNDEVIGRIVNLAELDGNDVVLEVGPGIGTLTVAMLSACRAVCSIEADRELEQVLAQTCATDGEKFALVMGDALRVTPAQVDDALAGLTKGQSLCQPCQPNKFVANLPYQVAATLILKFFQDFGSLKRACVMVQAEVADRICAAPGNKTYGAYTAKLALLARPTGRFEVGPAARGLRGGTARPHAHGGPGVWRAPFRRARRPRGRGHRRGVCPAQEDHPQLHGRQRL